MIKKTGIIKDRLSKIKQLVDRGYKGEALAAKAALERMLKRYNISLEEIADDTVRTHWIKVGRLKDLHLLLLQCYAKITKIDNVDYRYGKNEIGLELTNAQYADIMSLYDFHASQFKKERNKITKSLMHAYIHKHDIFSGVDSDYEETIKLSKVEREDLLFVLRISNSLEDVSYYKQIDN